MIEKESIVKSFLIGLEEAKDTTFTLSGVKLDVFESQELYTDQFIVQILDELRYRIKEYEGLLRSKYFSLHSKENLDTQTTSIITALSNEGRMEDIAYVRENGLIGWLNTKIHTCLTRKKERQFELINVLSERIGQ